MTKQEIVDIVSQATGLTKVETETVMNGVMGTIIDSLANNVNDCLQSGIFISMPASKLQFKSSFADRFAEN